MGSQQDTARRPYIYNILLKLFDGGGDQRGRRISFQLLPKAKIALYQNQEKHKTNIELQTYIPD